MNIEEVEVLHIRWSNEIHTLYSMMKNAKTDESRKRLEQRIGIVKVERANAKKLIDAENAKEKARLQEAKIRSEQEEQKARNESLAKVCSDLLPLNIRKYLHAECEARKNGKKPSKGSYFDLIKALFIGEKAVTTNK